MKPTASNPAPAPVPNFLEGAADHFEEFVREHAGARKIRVWVTFSDNRTLELSGLRVISHPTRPNCFQIRGGASDPGVAVVIRNDHVFKVEFAADPPPDTFGFPTPPGDGNDPSQTPS